MSTELQGKVDFANEEWRDIAVHTPTSEIYGVVCAIIKPHLRPSEQVITPQSTTGDLGLDDLDLIEIGMAIERDMGIDIFDEDIDGSTTICRLVELIIQKQS